MTGLKQRIEKLEKEYPRVLEAGKCPRCALFKTLDELSKTIAEIEKRRKVALKMMIADNTEGIRQVNKCYEYAYRDVLKLLDDKELVK